MSESTPQQPQLTLAPQQRQELEKYLLPAEQILWAGRTTQVKTSIWTDIWEILGLSSSETNAGGAREFVSNRRTYAVTNQRVFLVDDPDVPAQFRQVVTLEGADLDLQSLKILYPEQNGAVGTVWFAVKSQKQPYAFGRIDSPQAVKDLIFRTFSR